MPLRNRNALAASNGHVPKGETWPDNRLAFLDQALFMGHRAAGIKEVMQVVWVYEHPIDFDGLQRFHHNLGHGLLGRRIERSPLPFARHRWISDHEPSAIDFAEHARPRSALNDWADERSQLPVDSECGPGWHLGVLPLTDGSTAVTLVISHYLLDGLGLVVALADAILGNTRELGYPPPRVRTRRRALAQDARHTAREMPEVRRALVTAARQARRRRRESVPSRAAMIPARRDGGADIIVLPGVTIAVDLDDWDAVAKTLGGTSNTLVAALAAKLGDRIGRRRASDGAVTLHLPISQRTESDTRAIAVAFAQVSVDPTQLATDLRNVRAEIQQALRSLRERTDDSTELLSLVPFTPKRTWERAVDQAFADADRPVFCSNLGDMGSIVCRLDGTDCDYGFARGTRQQVTRQWLDRVGGQLNVLSLRAIGKIFISVLAYQPGAENTKPALRQLAAHTLAEFGLSGNIE